MPVSKTVKTALDDIYPSSQNSLETSKEWVPKSLITPDAAFFTNFNPQTPATVNQQGYASSYGNTSSKHSPVVTQIHVHFDRTMIASSASERDMMNSVEGRLGDVVGQFLTGALSQQQYS